MPLSLSDPVLINYHLSMTQLWLYEVVSRQQVGLMLIMVSAYTAKLTEISQFIGYILSS